MSTCERACRQTTQVSKFRTCQNSEGSAEIRRRCTTTLDFRACPTAWRWIVTVSTEINFRDHGVPRWITYIYRGKRAKRGLPMSRKSWSRWTTDQLYRSVRWTHGGGPLIHSENLWYITLHCHWCIHIHIGVHCASTAAGLDRGLAELNPPEIHV